MLFLPDVTTVVLLNTAICHNASFTETNEHTAVMDREAWRAAIHGVTKSGHEFE